MYVCVCIIMNSSWKNVTQTALNKELKLAEDEVFMGYINIYHMENVSVCV